MTQRLRHRGPDGDGRMERAGRGRWATADWPSWISRTAGHQPMVLGPQVLTYNGEIYNHERLRGGLAGTMALERRHRGAAAAAGAARQRLPRAAWSACSPSRSWDSSSRRLLLARDRLGIKPLYYQLLPDGIAFASELKALLVLGTPEIDRERGARFPVSRLCSRAEDHLSRNRQAAGRTHPDLAGRPGAHRALLASVDRDRAHGRRSETLASAR